MQDPHPENITGSKTVSHVVEHRINWGQVALGIALIYVVWAARRAVAAHSGEEQSAGDEVEVALTA